MANRRGNQGPVPRGESFSAQAPGLCPFFAACAMRRSPRRCHIRSATPFFAFVHVARLCVVAAVFVRYERPVSADRSSRDAETPDACCCCFWHRRQGWLRCDPRNHRRLRCLFCLTLYTSITIVESSKGRYASGQWPDPLHTVVKKCEKGSIT